MIKVLAVYYISHYSYVCAHNQGRLQAIKVKYLLLAWLGILIASWVLYMQYASYSELCRGHVCRMVIVSVHSQDQNCLYPDFISLSTSMMGILLCRLYLELHSDFSLTPQNKFSVEDLANIFF